MSTDTRITNIGDKAPSANSVGYGKMISSYISDLLALTTKDNNSSPFSSMTTEVKGTSSTDYYNLLGYEEIINWVNLLQNVKLTIFTVIDSSYNEYVNDIKQEDVAFKLLNATNNGSDGLFFYDKNTEKFTESLDYSECVNHTFQLQIELNKTEWLKRFTESIKKATELINDYQKYFESISNSLVVETSTSSESSDTDTDTRYKNKGEVFWRTGHIDSTTLKTYSIEDFTQRMNSILNIFNWIIPSFTQLGDVINEYTELFNSAMKEVGFMNTVITATMTNDSKLSTTLQSIGSVGFGVYSARLKAFYDKLIECKKLRDTSRYSDKDEYNVFLRKIATSEVLSNINFATSNDVRNYFTESKRLSSWMNNFRKTWNL